MKLHAHLGILPALLAGLLVHTPAHAEDRDPGKSIPGQENAQKDIEITNVSMQLVRPAGHVYALYFTLTNKGENAHLVTNVSSASCRTLVGHHSDQESTSGTLSLFTHLSLPANTTLVFPHGGYHLLCLDPEPALKSGQNVTFTFSFLGGSSKDVTVAVDQGKATE
ncbi:copper chaperone PCu(A)C [Acetobacter senegalensis]|uniref:copper chaperone PCu(A)C n=1 Tax=Acetobacter senegalensis TaxID=446692 RepID=UPI0026524512|nr:copper chaperone PCu(A)C [Acetobacter senegalensis]MDN7351005.1 copper chaperone PCu(A)C [Acetobacter senegalensis]